MSLGTGACMPACDILKCVIWKMSQSESQVV